MLVDPRVGVAQRLPNKDNKKNSEWAIPFNKHNTPYGWPLTNVQGGILSLVQGGQKTDFNEGKGVFWANLIVSRGENILIIMSRGKLYHF